jgi:hypothetical protein
MRRSSMTPSCSVWRWASTGARQSKSGRPMSTRPRGRTSRPRSRRTRRSALTEDNDPNDLIGRPNGRECLKTNLQRASASGPRYDAALPSGSLGTRSLPVKSRSAAHRPPWDHAGAEPKPRAVTSISHVLVVSWKRSLCQEGLRWENAAWALGGPGGHSCPCSAEAHDESVGGVPQCRVNHCRGRYDGCPTPGADAWGRTLISNQSDGATTMTITAIRTVALGRGFRFRRIVASVCAG